jgi:hypothetical protein
MKNEQRIWNKSELEKMPEFWKKGPAGIWFNDKSINCINSHMVGKSVQWCEDQCLIVTDEMIAKTETELVQEAVTQANDKLKERLDKGEIGITLENGVTIKIGGKYALKHRSKYSWVKLLCIGKEKLFWVDEEGSEFTTVINADSWLPYTEPKEEPKPLEGYQKWYCLQVADNRIMTSWFKKQPENNNHWNYYTESEVIKLGLKI